MQGPYHMHVNFFRKYLDFLTENENDNSTNVVRHEGSFVSSDRVTVTVDVNDGTMLDRAKSLKQLILSIQRDQPYGYKFYTTLVFDDSMNRLSDVKQPLRDFSLSHQFYNFGNVMQKFNDITYKAYEGNAKLSDILSKAFETANKDNHLTNKR
jgi:hypothetical protein